MVDVRLPAFLFRDDDDDDDDAPRTAAAARSMMSRASTFTLAGVTASVMSCAAGKVRRAPARNEPVSKVDTSPAQRKPTRTACLARVELCGSDGDGAAGCRCGGGGRGGGEGGGTDGGGKEGG